jgi:inorganic pyrophosphatase
MPVKCTCSNKKVQVRCATNYFFITCHQNAMILATQIIRRRQQVLRSCSSHFVHFDNIKSPDKMKFSTTAVVASFALAQGVAGWATVAPLSGAGRRTFVPSLTTLLSYTSEQVGETATESFRLQFKGEDGAVVSPWHDIPLMDGDDYNMVVEIPKYTKAKMEVSTKEESNPIAQDIKKGNLRDYHGPIFWNYGCLPQTWEDPNEEHPELKVSGDDDPIDVVEIGSAALEMGSVKTVKALGVLAMIDDGELDWKVVAVATDDPLAKEYNDIDDVPKEVKDGIREWFRW